MLDISPVVFLRGEVGELDMAPKNFLCPLFAFPSFFKKVSIKTSKISSIAVQSFFDFADWDLFLILLNAILLHLFNKLGTLISVLFCNRGEH